jgi:hypothetical protein
LAIDSFSLVEPGAGVVEVGRDLGVCGLVCDAFDGLARECGADLAL